jgi:hypothetical protein
MFSLAMSAFAGALRKSVVLMIPIALCMGAVVTRADAPAAGGSTLTVDQLGSALDSYGKNTSNNNGQVTYSVTVTRGTWNINVLISLSPNGKMIWMTNDATAIPAKLSAEGLANVLKKNSDIGPAFFSITNGNLRLSQPVPNYDLTPQAIHDNVEALVSTVVDTAPLWSTDALTAK